MNSPLFTGALALAIVLSIGGSSAALAKTYDCTKPGNANKAQCKAAAASSAPAPVTAAAAKPVPLAAPAGTALTAQCKDGTAWTGKIKFGACAGHKGVATWGAATTAAAALAAPKATTMKTVPASKTAPSATVVGGGAGQVWVNTKSHVYHCPSDPYYGKTKAGQYMTESAALAAGAHADHGKACH